MKKYRYNIKVIDKTDKSNNLDFDLTMEKKIDNTQEFSNIVLIAILASSNQKEFKKVMIDSNKAILTGLKLGLLDDELKKAKSKYYVKIVNLDKKGTENKTTKTKKQNNKKTKGFKFSFEVKQGGETSMYIEGEQNKFDNKKDFKDYMTYLYITNKFLTNYIEDNDKESKEFLKTIMSDKVLEGCKKSKIHGRNYIETAMMVPEDLIKGIAGTPIYKNLIKTANAVYDIELKII